MAPDDAARERLARDPATPLATLHALARDHPELRPAIAENPSTYPELLSWLLRLGEPEIDAALARRPRGGAPAARPPTARQPDRPTAAAGGPTEQEGPTEQVGPGGAAVPAEELAGRPAEDAGDGRTAELHLHTEEVGPGGSAVPLSDGERPTHEPAYDPDATAVYADPDLPAASEDRPPTFAPAEPVERPAAAVPTDAPTQVFRPVRDAGTTGATAVAPAGAGAEHGGGPVPWGAGPSGEAAADAAAAAAAESTARPAWRPPHGRRDDDHGPTAAGHSRADAPLDRPGTPAGGVPTGGAGRGALVMAVIVVAALFLGAALWFLLARTEPADDEGGGAAPVIPTSTSTATPSATPGAAGDVEAARSAVVALGSGSSCDDPAADAATIEQFADAAAPGGMWENPGDGGLVMTALRGLQDTCGAVHAVAVERSLLDSGSTALVTTLSSADPWVQLARPAPPGAQERTSFASPSGNIACSLSEESASCTIDERSFAGPGECAAAPVAAAVTLDGEAEVACAEEPAGASGALQYGQAATSGYFACTSAHDGVTCWSTLSGHGFTLARATVETF